MYYALFQFGNPPQCGRTAALAQQAVARSLPLQPATLRSRPAALRLLQDSCNEYITPRWNGEQLLYYMPNMFGHAWYIS